MVPVPPESGRSTLQRWVMAGIWLGLAMMLGSWLIEDHTSSVSLTALRLIGLGIVFVSVIPNVRKLWQWKRSARQEGVSRREIRRSTGLTVSYWVTMIAGIWLFQYMIDFVESAPEDAGRLLLAVAVSAVAGVVMGTRIEVVGAAARIRQGIARSEWWTSKAGLGTTLAVSIGLIIAALSALLAWPDRSGLRIVALIVVLGAGSGAGGAITLLRSPLADEPVGTSPTS